MLLKSRFPVSERVAAGISYKEMLAEAGALGCLVVVYMIVMEVNRLLGLQNLLDTTFFDLPSLPMLIVLLVAVGAYFAYTRSLGAPMYVFLLFVMILLAITELGTDTWIKELMGPAMQRAGVDSGWVLVYTATIMTILRFCIGPIERALKPLGVLLLGSLFAAVGLYCLASAEGAMILVMATIYGTGQCFFWPVTLGLVSERFPRGGALTLNAIAGVGMLGVGILGSQLLGFWQDTNIDRNLKQYASVYENVVDGTERASIFGNYRSLDGKKVAAINDRVALFDYRQGEDPEALAADPMYQTMVRNAHSHLIGDVTGLSYAAMHDALEAEGAFIGVEEYGTVVADKSVLDGAIATAKRNAMSRVAILPLIMALCYLGLIIYFRSRGGYKAIELTAGD